MAIVHTLLCCAYVSMAIVHDNPVLKYLLWVSTESLHDIDYVSAFAKPKAGGVSLSLSAISRSGRQNTGSELR